VLTGDRTFELHGSLLNMGDYLPGRFFLAFVANDRGVEVT